MWRASRVALASILAEKFKPKVNINFPTVIVDKTTQLYGSIETIQKKLRQRIFISTFLLLLGELVPSYLFDTTMEQINNVKDRYRLFSVHTPNEVSNFLQGMDQIFNRKSNEEIAQAQKLIGLILNTRELKFPPAAGRFPEHMERVTTTSIKTLQLLSNQGGSHYGHTELRYLGGPGTCIALGVGKLIVDNDAEGFFLTPCPMFSDCIYFRASDVHHQKAGLHVRFVSDAYYISKLFREASLEGTHHTVPDGEMRNPAPHQERVRPQMARRPVGARREEAMRRQEQREAASFVLGGVKRPGRPRSRPLPPETRVVHPVQPKSSQPRPRKVSLFLAPIRSSRSSRSSSRSSSSSSSNSSGRRGRPRRTGAVAGKPAVEPKPKQPKQPRPVIPFAPVITLEFLKQDNPDGEEIEPDEPRMGESLVAEEADKTTMEQEVDADEDENKTNKIDEEDELDPIDLEEQAHMESVDELGEIEEFDEKSARLIELEDLGELVEDLEDFERAERKNLLVKAISHVPSRLLVKIDDPYGDASQSGYMVNLGIKRKPYTRKEGPKLSKPKPSSIGTTTKLEYDLEQSTEASEKTTEVLEETTEALEASEETTEALEETPEASKETPEELEETLEALDEEPEYDEPESEESEEPEEPEPEPEPETLLDKRKKEHYRHAYTTPYPKELIEPILTLTPDQLQSVRIGYYNGRSEKVLPHISNLLSNVVQKIAANGMTVEKVEGTLTAAINKSQAVWATQPFAQGSPVVAEEIQSFFGNHDIILTPACPVFPPLISAGYPKKDSLIEWNSLYTSFRLAGCSVLQLPVVRSGLNGMPVSLQVVGRAGADLRVMQVAFAIERLCGTQYPIPMDLTTGDINAETYND